jgi:hypothetical protein
MKETSKATLCSKGNQQALSRRELLKIMSATGGALAASAFVPDTWLSPMVEIGVLPVHAQATAGITISELQYSHTPFAEGTETPPEVLKNFGIAGSTYYGRVTFIDLTGSLLQAICQIIMEFQSGNFLGYNILSLIYQTATRGIITWSFSTTCDPGDEACTQIKNTNTEQTSNTQCDQIPA